MPKNARKTLRNPRATRWALWASGAALLFAILMTAGASFALHRILATGRIKLHDPLLGLTELGAVAAQVVARAVARGVYEATALLFPGALPSWRDRFGR